MNTFVTFALEFPDEAFSAHFASEGSFGSMFPLTMSTKSTGPGVLFSAQLALKSRRRFLDMWKLPRECFCTGMVLACMVWVRIRNGDE